MDMQMVKQTGSEKPRGGIQLTELRKLVNDEEFSAAKLTDELFPGGLVSKQDAVALVRYLCHLPITWDEAGRAMNAILGHAYPCPSAQVWDAIEIVHLTWKLSPERCLSPGKSTCPAVCRSGWPVPQTRVIRIQSSVISFRSRPGAGPSRVPSMLTSSQRRCPTKSARPGNASA